MSRFKEIRDWWKPDVITPEKEYMESYVKYRTQLASIETQLGQFDKLIPTPRKLRCLFCDSEIPKDAESCPSCGEARVKCPVCWGDIFSGDRFVKCPHCDTTEINIIFNELRKSKLN